MAEENLKVIFKRVYVLDDSDWVGSGEFYFKVTVDGKAVGDPKRTFNAVEGTWIDLPADKWSAIVDVKGKNKVEVRFQGKDEDVISDDDLGTVGVNLRSPWTQRSFRQQTSYFILEWEVELEVDGKFGKHPPGAVFACREHNGSVDCTTVSGNAITARLEIHPVRPVPTLGLPQRAPFPPGTSPPKLNNGATNIAPGDPLNVIPNPSVIPLLSGPDPLPPAAPPVRPAGSQPPATLQNAARIEYTYYQPDVLAFTDNDPRLEWTARVAPGAAGGAVAFLDPATGQQINGKVTGLKVFAYGTAAGEVLLEVKFMGELMATYRALVFRVRNIPCRFNILNGPTAKGSPSAGPTDVQNHLAIANRYLYQMGIQLVLDTNPQRTYSGARPTTVPGIFRINVGEWATQNIDDSVADLIPTRLNYRPNVMNFAYVHSAHGGILGAATDFPNSTLAPPAPGGRPVVTDSGTPSNSWQGPTGIKPDGAAGAITMPLINGIQRRGHPGLFAMYVTRGHDKPGRPAAIVQQNYANTIAHEFMHILNLGHRVEGVPANPPAIPVSRTMTAADPPAILAAGGVFWDGLLYPPGENVMHWNNPGTVAQDIDIIQVRGALLSPLVPP